MWVMWNLALIHLEIVLVSVQDRCIVCAKHTIGSKIVFDAPDGTPGRVKWKLVRVHLEIVLILMQERYMVCAECTIRLRNNFGCT
jgi:hypothetical protein